MSLLPSPRKGDAAPPPYHIDGDPHSRTLQGDTKINDNDNKFALFLSYRRVGNFRIPSPGCPRPPRLPLPDTGTVDRPLRKPPGEVPGLMRERPPA